MTESEVRLEALLRDRSHRDDEYVRPDGSIGRGFIEVSKAALHSFGAAWIGEIFYERTRDLDIQAIGGRATRAGPLVAATLIAYQRHGRIMEGFLMHRPKLVPGRSPVEGTLKSGWAVALIDDVVMYGDSMTETIQRVTEFGARIVSVVALIGSGDGMPFLAQMDVPGQAVFTMKDLKR